MTNNSPDDLPNDDFKISEDKLREFLESSQQDMGASHLCKYSVIVMNTVTLKIQGTRATDDE